MQPFLSTRNRRLYLKLRPLVENKEEESSLSASVAAGAGTITVASINKFAVNKILLIGELGAENSEIIKTHASSAPSGSTVTLASNTVYAHPAGTKVYVIEYDQVEFSNSSTESGSKTTLTTTIGSGIVALEADETIQVYRETEYTTGYYFARFKNSIGGTFGPYSDAIPTSGYTSNMVGYVIEKALGDLSTELSNEITQQWFYDEINDCIRSIQGKLKRMNQYQSFDTVIGATVAGMYKIAMPADIYDTKSNRSLIAIRIGESSKLTYADPIYFEEMITGRIQTTVATQASVGATSLVVTDSDDLPDSGSIDVWVSNTKHTITYTGITRGTHTLTGIPASGTGAITVTTPVASNVYVGADYGFPSVYTVRNDYIEFDYIIGEDYRNKNIFADYWTVASNVNSDTDLLDSERYDMILQWVIWKLRCKVKNEGRLDMTDGNYMLFKEFLNDMIRTMPSSIKYKMKPNINGISYKGRGWMNSIKKPRKT